MSIRPWHRPTQPGGPIHPTHEPKAMPFTPGRRRTPPSTPPTRQPRPIK